jgi:dipeptidyl aminopeptidase/acylaminoacyl peptidase
LQIIGDWGGKPYQDCIAAVDYTLQQYSYLDAARVGALGASYGGYMINWINGHTDRFKCLVNHDGLFSLKSMYFSTEELYFPGMYINCSQVLSHKVIFLDEQNMSLACRG